MKRNSRSSAVSSRRPESTRKPQGTAPKTWIVSLALAASIGVLTQAEASEVRGSIRPLGDAKATPDHAVREAYWREWNGFIEPKKPSVDLAREVAVALIGSVATKDAMTVLLKDGQLSPSTIVMQQGTSLRVRNEDDSSHQLSATGLKSFDSIETSSGQGRQIQIDQPGTFSIRDALASHVRGTLHVLPKLSAVARPQADGTFVFAEVAEGDYTLKVFRGDKEIHSASIVVESSGSLVIDPINVDLKSGK